MIIGTPLIGTIQKEQRDWFVVYSVTARDKIQT